MKKTWKQTHKKDIQLYGKKYYIKHKQKLIKAKHKYRNKNRAKLRLYQKNYRLTHKRQIKKYLKSYLPIYYQNNKEKIYKQIKQKFKINPHARIVHNLRVRIRNVLKLKLKKETTVNLIGCSTNKLKQHLEKQFKRGMSWNNYGKWHIDHIKPCFKFNLTKLSEQKKCFNYKNLQPLWAKDNYSKPKK
jgi:hypothetical protein